MLLSYIRPVWAEIDLDNLAYNITQIRSFIGQNVKIMAVVKVTLMEPASQVYWILYWNTVWICLG